MCEIWVKICERERIGFCMYSSDQCCEHDLVTRVRLSQKLVLELESLLIMKIKRCCYEILLIARYILVVVYEL